MLALVTMLRYWKSEHTDETCEDALNEHISQGLFAVADGAGTTLFADAWADFLVRYFLHTPLLSNNPFEVEWWIRLAQEQFKHTFPITPNLSWNAQQKTSSQGSYSTLATLRIRSSDPEHATGEALALGDTCVFLNSPVRDLLFSFPLTRAEEFAQAPICLPSKMGAFNRYFHRAQLAPLDFVPGDTLVIATDAVAKWLISAGNACYSNPQEAFLNLSLQTSDTWPAFIEERRASQDIVDDDSSALLITFFADGSPSGIPLGAITLHSQPVRDQRKQAFYQARDNNHKEQIAIIFGDGQDLLAEDVTLSPGDLQLARRVADAFREVLAMLRQEVNNPNVVAIMTPLWQKHAHLLYNEPCAANVRTTLARLGVPLEPTLPPESEPSFTPTNFVEDEHMLQTEMFTIQPFQHILQSNLEQEEKEEHA
jgi:hypothetical protein